MAGVDEHRAALEQALGELGLDWSAWPGVVVDDRLSAAVRVSAVLVLLANNLGDEWDGGIGGRIVTLNHASADRLGRARSPWRELARTSLAWDEDTATTALQIVNARNVYDERRLSIALRAARKVCSDGRATTSMLDALRACLARLEWEQWQGFRADIKEMQLLARRVLASATPPDLLDLSLLAPGDTWGGSARAAAASLPAGDVASLVRLLGDLGPRKPPKKWFADVDAALEPPAARQLLREWLELAAHTDIVPEWPGAKIGDWPGTLFVGTNTDIVRAAVWAASRLPGEEWPPEILGVLARRGSAHNGVARFPEALALKVASAAVDVMALRNGDRDRQVLRALSPQLGRKDLRAKIDRALAEPDGSSAGARRKSLAPAAVELLRIEDDTALEVRAGELAASGPEGEAVVLEGFAKARGTKPYSLIRALASDAPGGEAERFLLFLVETDKDKRAMALTSLADVQKDAATPMLAEFLASHPSSHMRITALHCLALMGDRRGRQTVLDYFSRVLTRKGRGDQIPPLASVACSYLLRTAEGPEEVQQVARLLTKRRANLTPLDLRWVNEFWPGEWLTQERVEAPQPDIHQMHAFLVNPMLRRRYLDLY